MIIGLTGKRGTGKDTVASYLAEKHGFRAADFTRDVLAPELEKQGRQVTRDNLIDLAMEGRRKHHNGVWAEKLCDVIKGKGADDYTISGIRFTEEVAIFRQRFGEQFILISLVADDRARYERSMRRGTKGEQGMTFARYMETEKKPTETAILKTMELADYAVDNNGTLDDLFKEVETIIKRKKEN
jgi:dephospho-CoA kinase